MVEGNAHGRSLGPPEDRGGREGLDRQMEETELMLAHTRAFLDALGDGDAESEEYLTGLKDSLERNLDRLRRRTDGRE